MAEQETQIRQENADEAFKNIHGNPGGSAGVMDAVVIAETAAKVIAATAGAEESVAGGGEMMRAERAVSFSVFWDVANKVYKVHDPVVKFPDGSSTTLGQPTFSAATFIVEVTRKNGVYAAAWKLDTAPADSDRIVAVKIFKLLNSVVTQYHTGAIIVGGSAKSPWVYVKGIGWTNACVQIGNNIYSGDNIQGLSTNAAGSHFLTIDMTDNTMEITTWDESSGSEGIVSLYIGSIDNDGNQTRGIYTMPIVFAWT